MSSWQPPIQSNSDETSAGSHMSSEPAFLVIGKLRRPHGLEGEMSMEVLTDFPERLRSGKPVYVGEDHIMCKIRKARWQNDVILISFREFTSLEQVENFRNQYVYVKSDSLPVLADGEYYFHDLIGLVVLDQKQHLVGKVKDILKTGANDVYVVETDQGNEILIPAIESVVIDVDLEKRVMIIQPQDWE